MSNLEICSTSTATENSGILCGYGRKERDPNCGVYKEPTERGQIRQTDDDNLYQPVYWQQVTIPAQLADRITRLRVARGTEGRPPVLLGGAVHSRQSSEDGEFIKKGERQ